MAETARSGLQRVVRFDPPPAPKTPKAAATRRLLLDVAARLIVERGYDAVSMRDIAATAGLTKGAVYGHFRSKGQLLVEAIRWKLAEREHASHFSEKAADAERAITLLYDDDGIPIRLLEVDAAAAARHDSDVAAGLVDLYAQRQERIQSTIDSAQPQTVAWLISALSAGIAMKQAAQLPPPDAQELQALLVRVLAALA
jgi:AcrR family transcriptional regulator